MRVQTIVYANEIGCHEIPMFRGAIIASIGDEANVLFHNHMDDKYRYAYPMIQYKRIGKHASIVCINDACELLKAHLTFGDMELALGTRTITSRIDAINTEAINFDVQEAETKYKIQSWLPLNAENYKTYTRIESIVEKMEFLQNILQANILSMAKGCGVIFDKQVVVKLVDLGRPQKTYFKGIEMLSFNAVFKSNVVMPDNIGLGKAVSMGHGMIKKLKGKNE